MACSMYVNKTVTGLSSLVYRVFYRITRSSGDLGDCAKMGLPRHVKGVYMDQFWTKSYPPGMPHAINVTKYDHIADAMTQACEQFPEHVAFTSFNAHMTYAEFKQQAHTIATAWQGLGLKP